MATPLKVIRTEDTTLHIVALPWMQAPTQIAMYMTVHGKDAQSGKLIEALKEVGVDAQEMPGRQPGVLTVTPDPVIRLFVSEQGDSYQAATEKVLKLFQKIARTNDPVLRAQFTAMHVQDALKAMEKLKKDWKQGRSGGDDSDAPGVREFARPRDPKNPPMQRGAEAEVPPEDRIIKLPVGERSAAALASREIDAEHKR